ncbi:hypothetical protein VNO78_00675 [Psophocarpus tetragonolobus]|uniref:Homeobox domain-containing protein n=1 Tax=Psophocarpus tetragonolobus TaxID=3891 RepID=A0AAN9SXN1_PSOTE
MFLSLPAMNRSFNRENPDILIMMIAGKQIIRGVEEDKADQRERPKMGPVKPATQMSATAPNTNTKESDAPNLDGVYETPLLGFGCLNKIMFLLMLKQSTQLWHAVSKFRMPWLLLLVFQQITYLFPTALLFHFPFAFLQLLEGQHILSRNQVKSDMYIAPLDISGRDATVIIDEISQNSTPNPLIQCYSLDLNNQSHIINEISMLSGVQGEPMSNVRADACFINPSIIGDTGPLVTSRGKTILGDATNPMENTELQEHLVAGMAITPSSLAAILAARIGLEENLENSSALPSSFCSMGALGPFFNYLQGTSNPLSATFEDCGYNEVPSKWNTNKFPKAPEIDGTCQPYSSITNLDPNEWTSSNLANMANHAYHASNFSKELSLSLATSTTAGQSSEVSCSNVTPCMNGTMSGLEQASCSSSRELSINLGGNKYVQFSPEVLESRYLVGIQEILAQIARYSFGNLEQLKYSAAGNRTGGNKSASAFRPKRRIVIDHDANSMCEAHAESPLQMHAAESKKAQLLTLLQLVDNRYSQCLDEIHTVVSAFHAATELDPQTHAHFALQAISVLYKDLRERISNYILAMGSNFNNSCSEENEWSVETSFLQKQWALQQLKRKDQLWRPQRGLPERSVSVLRAWMFQNFLHPYPKDAEKHLLAVKSGLTRSQVSNWFINARVRLWKPMIEEMYAEMNKRKACRNEEGMLSNHGNRISMSSQNVNYR